MAGGWSVRGVPRALATDMWWLAEVTDSGTTPERQLLWQVDGWAERAAMLLALVVLADQLFYGHAPGLSLALFGGRFWQP